MARESIEATARRIQLENEESNRRLEEAREEERRRQEVFLAPGTEARPFETERNVVPAGEFSPSREDRIRGIRESAEREAIRLRGLPEDPRSVGRRVDVPTEADIARTFDEELRRIQAPTGEEGIVPTGPFDVSPFDVSRQPIGEAAFFTKSRAAHAAKRAEVKKLLDRGERLQIPDAEIMKEIKLRNLEEGLEEFKVKKDELKLAKFRERKVSTELSERALAEGKALTGPEGPALAKAKLEEEKETERIAAIPEKVKVAAALKFPDKLAKDLTPKDILAVRKDIASPPKRSRGEKETFFKDARAIVSKEADRLTKLTSTVIGADGKEREEPQLTEVESRKLKQIAESALLKIEKRGDVPSAIAAGAALRIGLFKATVEGDLTIDEAIKQELEEGGIPGRTPVAREVSPAEAPITTTNEVPASIPPIELQGREADFDGSPAVIAPDGTSWLSTGGRWDQVR